jgi:hypothetical protein
VDVRNRGVRKDLSVVLNPLAHHAVVGRLICDRRGDKGAPAAKPLSPGMQLDAMTFRLDQQWNTQASFGDPPPARILRGVDQAKALKLPAGRHIVRVAIYADAEGKTWVRALSNAVEIEMVEPGKKLPPAAIQTSPKVVQKGLALSIRLDKKIYQPDDVIDLGFTLRNETDKAIYVGDGYLGPDYQEVGPQRHFEVHAAPADQKPLTFWSGMMTEGTTSGIRKVFTLEPNEVYDGAIRLWARKEADGWHEERGGAFADKADKKHVLGVDASRYTVALAYQVDAEKHFPHQPPEGFKDQLMWKGKVTSEKLSFEMAAP